ncbi:MAG: hypothetical protein RIR62_2614 [Pseudomonadota bacterium]
MYRVSPFVRHFARALLGGAGLATLWVNLSPSSYYDFIEFRLLEWLPPAWLATGPVIVTPMRLLTEGLMSLFLFFIAKELWEALVLDRGALAGRRALLPAGAVLGGIAGAVGVWLLWGGLVGAPEGADPTAGWVVPVGSDVVICYVLGRLVFGAGHAALHLLLLITIAFDIAGLVLLGLSHAAFGPRLLWLLCVAATVLAVWRLYGAPPPAGASEARRRRGLALWPYGVAGVLFLFGLTRGGIDLMALAPVTGTVLLALWIGKPLGVLAGAFGAMLAFRLYPPPGISLRDIAVIAAISGLGFTVPVLAIDSALPAGLMAEATRLGLALSLLAGPAALLLARLLRHRKR